MMNAGAGPGVDPETDALRLAAGAARARAAGAVGSALVSESETTETELRSERRAILAAQTDRHGSFIEFPIKAGKLLRGYHARMRTHTYTHKQVHTHILSPCPSYLTQQMVNMCPCFFLLPVFLQLVFLFFLSSLLALSFPSFFPFLPFLLSSA
jgi:hypothetical protein